MVAHNDYYIYALFREDGVTPFYIGKGRRGRWREHEAIALREGRTHKDRIIRKMLSAGLREIPKAKICESLTEIEAAQIERDLIFLVGRGSKGPLSNLTDGGEGVTGHKHSAETRELLRTAWKRRPPLPPESRAKQSLTMKATLSDPVVLDEFLNASLRRAVRTEKTAEKLRAANLGKRHSAATKAKLSAARRRRAPTSQETKERMSRSQLAAAAARRLLPDGLSKKLKAVDVASIRRLRENGATQISIARQFGVAQSVVSAIVARRIWTHV